MKDFTDSLIEDIIDEASLNYWEQEQKMDAWHNGSRGLNIKACSDAKLELNWKICKAKGYNSEAQQLEAEGRARGLAWAQPQQPAQKPQSKIVNIWQNMPLTPYLFSSIMGKQVLDREKNDPMMIVHDFFGQNISFENKIRLITLALILAVILECDKCISEIKSALGIDMHPELKAGLKEVIGRVIADEQIKAKLNEIKKELEATNEGLDEKIVHLNNGDWQVQSEKGRNMGTYTTKKEAEKRLSQVEYFKHINEEVDDEFFDNSLKEPEEDYEDKLIAEEQKLANKYSYLAKDFTDKDINEDIEKHNTLNQKLFDENKHLRPEVREKLLQIADEFIKCIKDDEVKFILKDVKLVGSNASYNYNPDSDIDLHLVADTKSLKCPDDLYPVIYNLYKSAWNNKFTPTIHGIPVELYVETEADDPKEEVKSEATAEKLEERAMTDVPFDSEVKIGDKIKIHHMAGEDNSYDGKEGTVEHIDGIGQLHGTWGGVAVIPGVDDFEIINKGLKELKEINESAEDTKRLIGEEEDAEQSYQRAIDNPEATEKEIELYKHIRDEETEHKEELTALLNGKENPIKEAVNHNALVSNGMYSVLDDKWIKEPVVTEVPEVNQEEIDKALAPWLLRYNEIIKSPTIESIESFMDDLYKARQTSIATEGEYNPINHAFKSLRAAGNLDNLRELKIALKEKELSLE